MTGSAGRQAPNDDVGERDGHFVFDRVQRRQRPDTARQGPVAQPARRPFSQRARMALQAVPCVATSASIASRVQASPGGGRRLRHFLRQRPEVPEGESGGAGPARRGRQPEFPADQVDDLLGDAARGGVLHARHRDRARHAVALVVVDAVVAHQAERAVPVSHGGNDAPVDQRDVALREREGRERRVDFVDEVPQFLAPHPRVGGVGGLVRVGRAHQHAPVPGHDEQQAAARRRRAERRRPGGAARDEVHRLEQRERRAGAEPFHPGPARRARGVHRDARLHVQRRLPTGGRRRGRPSGGRS